MLDLAMTGKPKMDILRHLVIEMNMSILDTKNPKLAQVTLENLLRETGNLARGHDRLDRLLENEYPTTVHVVEDDNNTMLPPDSMCDTSIDDAVRFHTQVHHFFALMFMIWFDSICFVLFCFGAIFSASFAARNQWIVYWYLVGISFAVRVAVQKSLHAQCARQNARF
jgi:hypothetical protein